MEEDLARTLSRTGRVAGLQTVLLLVLIPGLAPLAIAMPPIWLVLIGLGALSGPAAVHGANIRVLPLEAAWDGDREARRVCKQAAVSASISFPPACLGMMLTWDTLLPWLGILVAPVGMAIFSLVQLAVALEPGWRDRAILAAGLLTVIILTVVATMPGIPDTA